LAYSNSKLIRNMYGYFYGLVNWFMSQANSFTCDGRSYVRGDRYNKNGGDYDDDDDDDETDYGTLGECG
jgi:hypothetical protein